MDVSFRGGSFADAAIWKIFCFFLWFLLLNVKSKKKRTAYFFKKNLKVDGFFSLEEGVFSLQEQQSGVDPLWVILFVILF